MKRKGLGLLAVAGLLALGFGCAGSGPYPPNLPVETLEDRDGVVLLDAGLRDEVTVTGQIAEKSEEGGLRVRAKILNRTGNQIWVQVQTEFKDASGFSYGDVTPWEFVRLEKNSTTPYSVTSMNDKAEHFTIRIKYPGY